MACTVAIFRFMLERRPWRDLRRWWKPVDSSVTNKRSGEFSIRCRKRTVLFRVKRLVIVTSLKDVVGQEAAHNVIVVCERLPCIWIGDQFMIVVQCFLNTTEINGHSFRGITVFWFPLDGEVLDGTHAKGDVWLDRWRKYVEHDIDMSLMGVAEAFLRHLNHFGWMGRDWCVVFGDWRWGRMFAMKAIAEYSDNLIQRLRWWKSNQILKKKQCWGCEDGRENLAYEVWQSRWWRWHVAKELRSLNWDYCLICRQFECLFSTLQRVFQRWSSVEGSLLSPPEDSPLQPITIESAEHPICPGEIGCKRLVHTSHPTSISQSTICPFRPNWTSHILVLSLLYEPEVMHFMLWIGVIVLSTRPIALRNYDAPKIFELYLEVLRHGVYQPRQIHSQPFICSLSDSLTLFKSAMHSTGCGVYSW